MARDHLATGYSLGLGASLLGRWAALYLAGELPGLAAAPYESGFHLVAEGATILALLAAGLGLVFDRAWADDLFPVSLGMALYGTITGVGYFAHRGEDAMAVLLGLLALLTLALLAVRLRSVPNSPDRLSSGGDFSA